MFPERRCSWNMEHGNRNVGHVPVPRLLRVCLFKDFPNNMLDARVVPIENNHCGDSTDSKQ